MLRNAERVLQQPADSFLERIYAVEAGGERVLAMEGMRGVAVLLVFCVHYHALFQRYLADASAAMRVSRYVGTVGHAGVDLFFGLGPSMRHAVGAARDAGLGGRARHFESLESLVAALQHELRPGDAVLIKGSRGSRMERVVAALAAEVT